MSIFTDNERLLKEWEITSINNNEQDEFVPDGILYRGNVIYSSTGGWAHERGNEEELWEHSSKRILYITKDLNDEGAWDIRVETGRRNNSGEDNIQIDNSSRFCKNYLYQVYGLRNVTVEHFIDYGSFSDEEAIQCFDHCTLARINVKKQLGTSSIKDYVLAEYINRYSDLIKRQILLLDADIIVSCGSKIFNFVKQHCYNLDKINDWIYYDNSLNKIVINSWHPSYPYISPKDFYTEMMKNYYDFLQSHPQFLNIKR